MLVLAASNRSLLECCGQIGRPPEAAGNQPPPFSRSCIQEGLHTAYPQGPFNDRKYDGQTNHPEVLSTTMSASIRDVGVGHYIAFVTALANILRTDLAEHTYAEIIDGAPTADTWVACKRWRHDIIEQHKELCTGTLEAARQFLTDFRPENLSFNPAVRTPHCAHASFYKPVTD